MNHEFAHEWFANQLSVANYDDLWLHEGLGSYAQPLIAEYLGGEIDYMAQLKSQRAGIRNEQPLVTGRERGEKEVYADPTGPRGDIYPKGSWVAHTLRKLIGDEAFFTSIRTLVYGRPDPRPGNFTPQFGTTQGFLEDRERRHRQGLQVVLRRLPLSRRAAQGGRDARERHAQGALAGAGQSAVPDAARRARRRQGRDAADDQRHGRDAGRRARAA